MFHYTNTKGFNAIRSQRTWLFKASQPPGNHLEGAYFTTLPPRTINLGKRIFVRGCRDKLELVFHFSGDDSLKPSTGGGRGQVIFYSPKGHLLAYPDTEADAMWDADSPDSPLNSMLYLILSENCVTAVLDDPDLGGMPAILEGIRTMMEMEILNTEALCYAEVRARSPGKQRPLRHKLDGEIPGALATEPG